MKVFHREEMVRLEEQAVSQGVTLSALMEGAGTALADETEKRMEDVFGKRAVILCGSGNNGGDGFVCARRLRERGMNCSVIMVQGDPETDLSWSAYEKLPQDVPCLWTREESREAMEQADVILDCIFGFGFRGRLPGEAAEFIAKANRQRCLRIAADLPSGCECDTGRVSSGAFRADVTVAFTGKKPAHVSYPAREYCGEITVCRIGIPEEAVSRMETSFFETDGKVPRLDLNLLTPQSHKGDLGKLLMVCGSYGMAGACVMAAGAALRSGVGLLQIAVEQRLYPILAPLVPEAVFLPLDWESQPMNSGAQLMKAMDSSSACLVGCGSGEMAETVCPIIFSHCTAPLVVDADALNFAARHPGVLETITESLILTPHPGEMARLCGRSVSEIQEDRLSIALRYARETGAVTVLKGAGTVTASPDGRCALNPSGNPGMAKGGSGDVLAGIIASLAAQGIPAFEAAAAGAYIHGMAGDLCAERMGRRGMLPTDLIGFLPAAFRSFSGE